MAKILFFDTECNSLDVNFGFVMELAWAVYHIESKRLLKCQSHIIKWGKPYTVEKEAFSVTGLTREFCETNGRLASEVFTEFLMDLETCDAVAGHNVISFDRPMLKSNVKRCLFNNPDKLDQIFTFDTMFDCPYPTNIKVMSLKYLALDHGYILSDAHQAMADVYATAAIFFKYPFLKCFEIAKTPIVTATAWIDFNDTYAREMIRKERFIWNRDQKRWEKKMREFFLSGTQTTLDLDRTKIHLSLEQLKINDQTEELPF